METENVFVLVDSSLEECGASVYRDREKLLAAVRKEYELSDESMEELDLNGKVDLGESTLFIVNGVPLN